MADWTAIKTEYIADPKSSYRSLAKKYGVSASTLMKRASAEHWADERKQNGSKVEARITEKIASRQVKQTVKQVSGIQLAADGMIEQILEYVNAGELDPDSIAKLTRSLKDLKDIKHDLTEYELREQDMRLRALEKQINAGTDDENDALGVIFLPGAKGKLMPPED